MASVSGVSVEVHRLCGQQQLGCMVCVCEPRAVGAPSFRSSLPHVFVVSVSLSLCPATVDLSCRDLLWYNMHSMPSRVAAENIMYVDQA